MPVARWPAPPPREALESAMRMRDAPEQADGASRLGAAAPTAAGGAQGAAARACRSRDGVHSGRSRRGLEGKHRSPCCQQLPAPARARCMRGGRSFLVTCHRPVQKARGRGGEDGENVPKRPSNPAGLYLQECYKDARVLPQYPASAPTAPPSARLAPASSIAWTLRCGPFLTPDESSCAVCPVACRLPRHRSVLC
jgi:hypothetical protein